MSNSNSQTVSEQVGQGKDSGEDSGLLLLLLSSSSSSSTNVSEISTTLNSTASIIAPPKDSVNANVQLQDQKQESKLQIGASASGVKNNKAYNHEDKQNDKESPPTDVQEDTSPIKDNNKAQEGPTPIKDHKAQEHPAPVRDPKAPINAKNNAEKPPKNNSIGKNDPKPPKEGPTGKSDNKGHGDVSVPLLKDDQEKFPSICQNCGKEILIPEVKLVTTQRAWYAFIGLFFCCCWWISWIPFVITKFKFKEPVKMCPHCYRRLNRPKV